MKRTLLEGLIAGLLGYLAVAVFFALFNLAGGHSPFYTAELLSAVVLGQGAGAPGVVHVGDVLALNGLHLVSFLVLGLGAAVLMHETELHPAYWYLALTAFLAGFVATVAASSFLTASIAADVPGWTLPVANGLAAALAALYLTRAHPRLWSILQRRADPDHPAGT